MTATKMLLANPEKITAMLTTDGDFSYQYAGWDIKTPPPGISGHNNYPPTPTTPVLLQSANGAWIKAQTVTPGKSNSQNLSASGTTEDNHWITIDGNSQSTPIGLTLTTLVLPGLTYSYSVTLTLNMAACAPGPAQYGVEVNGQLVATPSPTDQNWHDEQIDIPATALRNGENHIRIIYYGHGYGIWVQSITVVSKSINISASYQWEQIVAGFLPRGASFDEKQTISHGTNTSNSSTMTYGQEFGISTSIGGIESLLSGLSAQLSASFSFQESTEHSVSISNEFSQTYGPNIGPAPSGGLTYQVWSLNILYEANGKKIVQGLGKDGPIIVCQYPND